jgi:Flp pilus assembly protein TadD
MYQKTLKLIVSLDNRRPDESQPPRLDALVQQRAADPMGRNAYAVEDTIWDVWTDHPDPLPASMMNNAIAAVAEKNYTTAEHIFTELVAARPNWAEAWNKRATLYFLLGRDTESVLDLHRALELEPRHFGALSGFAQICLRNGDRGSALVAFEAALRINPHLTMVQDALVELQNSFPSYLH